MPTTDEALRAPSYVVRAGELGLGLVTTPRPIASFSEAKHGAFSDLYYDGNVGMATQCQ